MMNNKKQALKQLDIDLSKYDVVGQPHSDALEKTVLGVILMWPATYNPSLKYLNQPGMFYGLDNEKVWQEIKAVANQRIEPSLMNVKIAIEGRNDKDSRALAAYTSCLIQHSADAANFINHCLKLNEYWIQRRIYKVGYSLNQKAIGHEIDALDLLGAATDSIDVIYKHIAGMKESTLGDAVKGLSQQVIQIHESENKMLGLRSSLAGINNVIKGYRKGNLIVVGASTSEGKSTLAFQEALFMAEQGIPVGICLLEMTTDEFLLMLACNRMGITTEPVMSGELTPEQMTRLGKEMDYLKTLPIKISDKSGLRIGEVKAFARMWVKHDKIQIFYVDHLHLIKENVDQANPEQRFTNIANELKELAKELKIPVMALAQLARKEVSEVKPHKVTDLKYAGGIEQAADVILLIFRPEHHGIEKGPNGESTKGLTRIIVGKVRLLPKKDIYCHFTGLKFIDREVVFHRATPTATTTPPFGTKQPAPLPSVDKPSAGIRASYDNKPGFMQKPEPYKHDDHEH